MTASEFSLLQQKIQAYSAKLVAVSKTKPIEDIEEVYNFGQRIFGENKVQELDIKQPALPSDIEWHMIGHLQSNKVKYIAPYISLIHAIDSIKLLEEINKQAAKNNRIIPVLLQVHIAKEESKFGFDEKEIEVLLKTIPSLELDNILINGLMGMATNTDELGVVKNEFKSLKLLFDQYSSIKEKNIDFKELSMGMSGDYEIALDEGSTLVRIGSAIFGNRV